MVIQYRVYIGVILSLLLASCHSAPDSVYQTLSQVADCMDSQPDSAFNLLKRIPHPESLRGEAQANYCLLMTKAMDKNYVKFDSDSLISIAANYYATHDADVVKKGESLFYKGRVLRVLNRLEEAMHCCLESEKLFEDSHEYKLLGLNNEEMGNINWTLRLFDEALRNYRHSKTYYEKASEQTGVSVALRNIGRTYMVLKNHPDSALIYHQQALQVAREYQCSSEFSILQGLGVIFRTQKEYEKAITCFLQALQLDENKEAIAETKFSIGYTYLRMQDMGHAEEYLTQSLDSANNKVKAGAYSALYKVEKSKGNLMAAMEYMEKSDSLKEVVRAVESLATIADLQKKYDNEKLQKENLQMQYRHGVFFSVCILLVLIIGILISYYRYKHRQVKSRIQEIEQTIRANEEQITHYQRQIEMYKSLQHDSEDFRHKVADLSSRVLVLTTQNKDLQEQLTAINNKDQKSAGKNMPVAVDEKEMKAFRLLVSLKAGIKRDLTTEDWSNLFDLVNYLFDNFLVRLLGQYPKLTVHDLKICCLLKFYLSHEDISRVLFTTTDTLTKGKGRLKKRLELPASVSMDEFIHKF